MKGLEEYMKVFESLIDICSSPVFDDFARRREAVEHEFSSVQDRYFTPAKTAPAGAITQERALIDLFWERAGLSHKTAKEIGYIGSYHNCVLQLLYGILGVDIIKFLFDQASAPHTTVDPFRPKLFLERLSVLERVANRLKDGSKTPVRLPETAPYVQSGMGPRLERFSEEQHRLLLDYSLRELRDFGELGLLYQSRSKKVTVEIHIYTPHEELEPEGFPLLGRPR
jgi:hypothetical protein